MPCPRSALALIALAALSRGAVAQQSDLDVAQCVFDTILATSFLAKASFQIVQATVECPANQAGCSSEISKSVFSFLFAGSFISAAANQCGAIANMNAACSANILELLGQLSGLSGASSSLVNTCVVISKGGETKGGKRRRLYSQPPQILGKCIMNTFISTNLLGLAGTQIAKATTQCTPQTTQNEKAACSAQVSGVIAALGTVAAFLSKAASQCAETVNLAALCSGDASGIIAHLAGVSQAASGMVFTCPQPNRRLQEQLLAEMRNTTVVDRRLQEELLAKMRSTTVKNQVPIFA